jgi:hypothetical protein
MPFLLRMSLIALLSVLIAVPANAFGMGGGSGGRGKRRGPEPEKAESAQKTKAREEAYKNALKNIPDAKANNDPWKGAR